MPAVPAVPAPETVPWVGLGAGQVLGSASAPVTIVEFSDFHCPYCRVHFLRAFPELRRDYIDPGKVRYVHRDFPMGAEGRRRHPAAEAARCAAEQGLFWEMHRELFGSRGGASGARELVSLSRKLPLDVAEFEACLRDGTYAATVRDEADAGRRLGVAGTPTFFIGRSGAGGVHDAARLQGARPATQFRRLIDPLLPGGP